MKRKSLILFCLSAIVLSLAACSKDSDTPLYEHDTIEYDAGRKILVAYFSWGGNTQHVAEHIASLTGGTLFRIEPEKPYPTEYKPCTEVAKAEKESNARPAIKNKVENWDETLAKVAELTPAAEHLKGFGAVNKSTKGIEEWLRTIRLIR